MQNFFLDEFESFFLTVCFAFWSQILIINNTTNSKIWRTFIAQFPSGEVSCLFNGHVPHKNTPVWWFPHYRFSYKPESGLHREKLAIFSGLWSTTECGNSSPKLLSDQVIILHCTTKSLVCISMSVESSFLHTVHAYLQWPSHSSLSVQMMPSQRNLRMSVAFMQCMGNITGPEAAIIV